MNAAALKLDQEVDVREENGRIIIEPIADRAYELDELLGRMSEDTFHDDIDFGPTTGREAW